MEKSLGICKLGHIINVAKLKGLDLADVVDVDDGLACRESLFFVKSDNLWCGYVENHRLPFKVCSFDDLTDISYNLYPPDLGEEASTEIEIYFDTDAFRVKFYFADTDYPKPCSSVSICNKDSLRWIHDEAAIELMADLPCLDRQEWFAAEELYHNLLGCSSDSPVLSSAPILERWLRSDAECGSRRSAIHYLLLATLAKSSETRASFDLAWGIHAVVDGGSISRFVDEVIGDYRLLSLYHKDGRAVSRVIASVESAALGLSPDEDNPD